MGFIEIAKSIESFFKKFDKITPGFWPYNALYALYKQLENHHPESFVLPEIDELILTV